MLILALKFVLAHIVGDFVLQPASWVNDKKKNKHKSRKLYWHLGIHTLALLLALQFDFQYLLGILAVVISHFIIDLGKLSAHDKMNEQWLFFIDQALHLFVIGMVVNFYEPLNISATELYQPQYLLLLVFLLLATFVTSICIKVLISTWKPQEQKNEALSYAGAYIGMLERLFIFGFIVIQYWEGIGFLLAAKSVFRFGDLSRAEDRKLTEYILIGTLLSFGLAILIASGYNYLNGIIAHL